VETHREADGTPSARKRHKSALIYTLLQT